MNQSSGRNGISAMVVTYILIGVALVVVLIVVIIGLRQYRKHDERKTKELREWISKDKGGEVMLSGIITNPLGTFSEQNKAEYAENISLDPNQPTNDLSRTI